MCLVLRNLVFLLSCVSCRAASSHVSNETLQDTFLVRSCKTRVLLDEGGSTSEFTLGPAKSLLLPVRKGHIIPGTPQTEHAATLSCEERQLLLRKHVSRSA